MINPNGMREKYESWVSLCLSHVHKGILQEIQINSAAQQSDRVKMCEINQP